MQGDGSEDECIGCFSLFQFSCDVDGPALEGALAAAAEGPRRSRGAAGASSRGGSGSESGDDVALEVNSWWLEHLEERVRVFSIRELIVLIQCHPGSSHCRSTRPQQPPCLQAGNRHWL
jgi:hypothetical protein